MSDNNLFDWLNDNQDDTTNETYSNNEYKEVDKSTENYEKLKDEYYREQEAKDRQRLLEEEQKRKSFEEDEKLRKLVREEVKKNKPRFRFLKACALILVGSILGAYLGNGLALNKRELPQGQIEENNAVNISVKDDANVENAVAQKAIPSVVGIQVNITRMGGIFGNQMMQAEAIGSGVIVSNDGYILTNAHVVKDADDQNINVLFHDNKNANAKLIWKDEYLDLAIIKAEASGLTPIELADSDQVKIGDKAIAIGNPVGLNLQSTLTSGYISGVNRSIQMDTGYVMDGLFQTDAAINSGNSGGALLNSKGQLIGINTAKVQSTDGIGFAIPANVAKSIVTSIVEKGNFKQVQLGIQGVNLDVYKQYTANSESIKTEYGVVVLEVLQNGSSNGKLKTNDIIVGLDDKKVESMNKLKQLLLQYKIQDKVTLNVIRDGKEEKVDITFMQESNL